MPEFQHNQQMFIFVSVQFWFWFFKRTANAPLILLRDLQQLHACSLDGMEDLQDRKNTSPKKLVPGRCSNHLVTVGLLFSLEGPYIRQPLMYENRPFCLEDSI